jgi:hypothetical protein
MAYVGFDTDIGALYHQSESQERGDQTENFSSTSTMLIKFD